MHTYDVLKQKQKENPNDWPVNLSNKLSELTSYINDFTEKPIEKYRIMAENKTHGNPFDLLKQQLGKKAVSNKELLTLVASFDEQLGDMFGEIIPETKGVNDENGNFILDFVTSAGEKLRLSGNTRDLKDLCIPCPSCAAPNKLTDNHGTCSSCGSAGLPQINLEART